MRPGRIANQRKQSTFASETADHSVHGYAPEGSRKGGQDGRCGASAQVVEPSPSTIRCPERLRSWERMLFGSRGKPATLTLPPKIMA